MITIKRANTRYVRAIQDWKIRDEEANERKIALIPASTKRSPSTSRKAQTTQSFEHLPVEACASGPTVTYPQNRKSDGSTSPSTLGRHQEQEGGAEGFCLSFRGTPLNTLHDQSDTYKRPSSKPRNSMQ